MQSFENEIVHPANRPVVSYSPAGKTDVGHKPNATRFLLQEEEDIWESLTKRAHLSETSDVSQLIKLIAAVFGQRLNKQKAQTPNRTRPSVHFLYDVTKLTCALPVACWTLRGATVVLDFL